MSLMDTIKAIIADIDPETPDIQVAEEVVRQYRTLDELRMATFRLVVDEVRRRRRIWDRNIQMGAFRLAGTGLVELGETLDNDRAEYMTTRVWVPKEGMVVVGEMTIDQHRRRIKWLEGQKFSLDQDIEFHNSCISRIMAAGVDCLNDVDMAMAS